LKRFSLTEKREVAQTIWPNGIKVMPSSKVGFKGWDSTRLVPFDWVAG
jgi:hypothetical protein